MFTSLADEQSTQDCCLICLILQLYRNRAFHCSEIEPGIELGIEFRIESALELRPESGLTSRFVALLFMPIALSLKLGFSRISAGVTPGSRSNGATL